MHLYPYFPGLPPPICDGFVDKQSMYYQWLHRLMDKQIQAKLINIRQDKTNGKMGNLYEIMFGMIF